MCSCHTAWRRQRRNLVFTWPDLRVGTGTSTSCSTSVPPHSEICTAFMAAIKGPWESEMSSSGWLAKVQRVHLPEEANTTAACTCWQLPPTAAVLGQLASTEQCGRLRSGPPATTEAGRLEGRALPLSIFLEGDWGRRKYRHLAGRIHTKMSVPPAAGAALTSPAGECCASKPRPPSCCAIGCQYWPKHATAGGPKSGYGIHRSRECREKLDERNSKERN